MSRSKKDKQVLRMKQQELHSMSLDTMNGNLCTTYETLYKIEALEKNLKPITQSINGTPLKVQEQQELRMKRQVIKTHICNARITVVVETTDGG